MLDENISQECIHLDESDKEFEKYHKPAKIFGWICGLLTLAIIIIFQPTKPSDLAIEISQILLVIATIMLVIGIYYSKKGMQYKIGGTKAILLNFYRSYRYLENYQTTKLKSRQEIAKKELSSAMYVMSKNWSKFEDENLAFKEFAKPINDLVENLGVKFIPAIITDDESKNGMNLITITNMIKFLASDHYDFTAMNSLLDGYPESAKKGVTAREYIQKNPLLKNGLLWGIFIGVGGLVTLISHFVGGDNQTLIIVWVTVSTAAVTIYYTAIKKAVRF